MAKDNRLSKKDICDIIKTLDKSNVSHFEYEGLKILRDDMVTLPSGKKVKQKDVAKEPPETFYDQHEYSSKDEMISTLHIEDPVAYEALLASGELTDKVGSNG